MAYKFMVAAVVPLFITRTIHSSEPAPGAGIIVVISSDLINDMAHRFKDII
jgi:hypothetical protein